MAPDIVTVRIIRQFRILTLTLLCWCFLPLCGSADPIDQNAGDCITRYPSGTLNWTNGTVTATGSALPDPDGRTPDGLVHMAAKYDAAAKIIETLKQIRINDVITVGDYASGNLVILTGLERISREAVVRKQIYTSAMAVDITLQADILGGFLQLALPEEIRQIPLISPDTPSGPAIPQKEKLPYTGLIIDARGLGLEPALDPVIISEQGQQVYSSAFISREFAVQKGVCRYVCRPDLALQDRRVGSRPLVFKGLRSEGKKNTTLVISMADYQTLEKVTERHGFFSECRVVIVLDP